MAFLTIFNKNIFLKTQGTRLGIHIQQRSRIGSDIEELLEW